MEALQYPIGKYIEQPFSDNQLEEWLLDIQYLPNHVEHAILNLDEAQLETAYRDGGWTVKQLVHHIADSHVNAYTRFKLGLTEDKPLVKAYDENAWAALQDTASVPINVSITLLFALHQRWLAFLKNIKRHEWDRMVVHSATEQEMSLWYLLGMYAWHGKHHVAHIVKLRERMKW